MSENPEEVWIEFNVRGECCYSDQVYSDKLCVAAVHYVSADKFESLSTIAGQMQKALELNQVVYEMFLSVQSGDVGATELASATNATMELNDKVLQSYREFIKGE